MQSPIPSFEDVNRPRPIGRVHPELQQVDSEIKDVASLMKQEDCAFWQSTASRGAADGASTLDLTNLRTWFPSDPNRTAFWTPRGGSNKYDNLTYAELQQELDTCPPLQNSPDGANVAIVVPAEEMAGMATAILSTIARNGVAVPLDPRMPPGRLVEAMEQLDCAVLVATKSVLTEHGLFRCSGSTIEMDKTALNNGTTGNLQFLEEKVTEVRLVTPGPCGRLAWEVFRKASYNNNIVMWTKVVDSSSPPKASSTFDGRLEVSLPSMDLDDDMPGLSLITPTSASSGDQSLWSPQSPDSDHSAASEEDICMLLRTSGTTSKPKVVPITRRHLFYAGLSIATTLKLRPNDCNCNAMPLFHIGGISCNLVAVLVSGGSVLLAGPLKDPEAFIGHLTIGSNTDQYHPQPTWYYASPAMHKAISLLAQAKGGKVPNEIRFIRSASAHLNHDLALQLSSLFDCGVIPTYGMSEAMPIASSTPIVAGGENQVKDSVGYPVGTSVRIADPEDRNRVLKYGEIGEICVSGAGVIKHYVGMDVAKTHTSDGWLPTGDFGTLDRQGRLFIKGRSKEMIKRGGEQIWPNQIDDVIEKVAGVATSVSFGVPNELLGEEVATAIVLKEPERLNDQLYIESLQHDIQKACKQHLSSDAMPQQFKFLPSTSSLKRGATGKYLRSQMADHLKLEAVETGALRVLETVAAMGNAASTPNTDDNNQLVIAHKKGATQSKQMDDPQLGRVLPHDSLNGLRFLVACFVVQGHVGQFPNLTWAKLQGYSPNMMIFFALGVIQTTLSVARPVTGQYGQWVGTKIGSLHALFVLSQIVTLPSTILFSCLDEDGNHTCDAADYGKIISFWVFGTATGMSHGLDGNIFAWFQSVYYMFLMMFPMLDGWLRRRSLMPTLACIMVLGSVVAASIYPIMARTLPSDVFLEYSWLAHGTIFSWFPYVVAGMCASYFFRYFAKKYAAKQRQEARSEDTEPSRSSDGMIMDVEAGTTSMQSDNVEVEDIKDYSKHWGYVCDVCSMLLFAVYVMVAMAPDCLCLSESTFEAMRPGTPLPENSCWDTEDLDEYVMTCDITYDEFYSVAQPMNQDEYTDRFKTLFAHAAGNWKIVNPLILVWIISMGFGNGITSRILGSRIMGRLAHLSYPVYLLHMSVSRYYWLATRGLEAEYWWPAAGVQPFPVGWYEYFIVLAITSILGYVINIYMVPMLMPHSISLGVRVATKVCDVLYKIFPCCCCFLKPDNGDWDNASLSTEDEAESSSAEDDNSPTNSSYEQLRAMVRGLTGMKVTRSMELRNLGLDSLGATALLGMLRASVPSAKSLTLQQLQECETIGDLSSFLDEPEASA